MLKSLRRELDNVVKSSQIGSRTITNCACGSSGRFWPRFRHQGVRFNDSWFCSPECAGPSLLVDFRRCLDEIYETPRHVHRMPLGLLMLSRGFVSEDQVRSALQAQRHAGRDKIGQWLQRLGFASERQVVTALALQCATPVLAFPADTVSQTILPIGMLKALRIVPVRFSPSRRLLYVAFCSPVDHTLLQSIEKMTGWRASACVVSDACMDRLLEDLDDRDAGRTHYFTNVSDCDEMKRIALSYAIRVGAQEIRLARCVALIWIRLMCGPKHSDLIFEIIPRSEKHIGDTPREA